MTSIDFSKTAATSKASGLKNYKTNKSFSVSVPAQTLLADQFHTYNATLAMDNSQAVSLVQIKRTGLDNFWEAINSGFAKGFFAGSTRTYTSAEYLVQTRVFFKDSVLTVSSLVINLAGVDISVPAFTIDCNASLFKTPF